LLSGTSVGYIQCSIPAAAIGLYLGGGLATIDNVSIRELPGNHATQSTSTARPTLQTSGGLYYLDFDGVDDFIQTSTITIATSPDFSMGVGVSYSSLSSGNRTFFSWGGYVSGGFLMQSLDAGSSYRMRLARNGTTFTDTTGYTPVNEAHVWLAENSSSGAELTKDSVSQFVNATVTNMSSQALALGYRIDGGGQQADANIYAVVAINRTLTTAEIEATESYLATKSGVTLP